MSRKQITVIGSGKRVREAALPALRQLAELYDLRRIFAKRAKEITVEGQTYGVSAFEELTASDLEDSDLLYLAVSKDAVPSVLQKLKSYDLSRIDLLIDTPVVRFKHFRHVEHLEAFRNAWVAEDCVVLPWFDVVRATLASGAIGTLSGATFFRSAYAYHGVASAKALLGPTRVMRGRRRRLDGERAERILTLAGGRSVRVIEPRDYSQGYVIVHGSRGAISDGPLDVDGTLALETIVSDGSCHGFRVGDTRSELTASEIELMGPTDPGARVTACMEPMKRVGFYRLLHAIHAGTGAYALDEALDDMVVDYHLEKFGLYLANPFTSPRSGLGRFLLRTLTRAGGG